MTLIGGRMILVPVAFALGLASGAYVFGGEEEPRGEVRATGSPIVETGGPSPELSELRALIAASEQDRRRLEDGLFLLEERVVMLEQSLQAAGARAEAREGGEAQSSRSRDEGGQTEALTEEALVAAGIEPQLAASIVRRQAATEMRRLELRDEAIRDEWFGSERYFDALAEVNAETVALREEIGDEAYDRYLYASGEDNRVVVTSVIPGSPAEQAGLRSGDVVLSYAGQELFSGNELRTETTQGQRGEPVTVRVRRGAGEVDLLLPRGPMGVRLDSARVEPRG